MALQLRNFPNHSLLMAFSVPTPLDLLEAYEFCGRLKMWTWNIFALLIHVPVKVEGSISNSLLFAIDASPRWFECRVLWINLSIIDDLHDLPQVMVGDFNDIISSEDKQGNRPSASHIAEFHACLNYCNLIYLGFSGPKYTWTNSQGVSSLNMQRLDRDFANPNWHSLFPEAIVTHLTHTHLDHCPILLAFITIPFASLPVLLGLRVSGLLTLTSLVLLSKLGPYPPPISRILSTIFLPQLLLGINSILVTFSRKNACSCQNLGYPTCFSFTSLRIPHQIRKVLREELNTTLKLEEKFWTLKYTQKI